MPGDRLESLASYLPARVARQLAESPAQPDGPRADRFDGAVLFADTSGFTALTESLARRGDAGVEDLTRALSKGEGHCRRGNGLTGVRERAFR